MPKTRSSKSQAARDYLRAHPRASVAEIIAALRAQGVEITPALASKIKYSRMPPEAQPARVNKSDAIRRYLRRFPQASPKNVAAKLSKRLGVPISPQMVSSVRHQARREALRSTLPPGEFTYSQLLRAKRLADIFGGIDAARQALAKW